MQLQAVSHTAWKGQQCFYCMLHLKNKRRKKRDLSFDIFKLNLNIHLSKIDFHLSYEVVNKQYTVLPFAKGSDYIGDIGLFLQIRTLELNLWWSFKPQAFPHEARKGTKQSECVQAFFSFLLDLKVTANS